MDTASPISTAVDRVGVTTLARACGVTHQAVRKWERKGRLPRTEWTGETRYAEAIERATEGAVTASELLGQRASAAGPQATPDQDRRTGRPDRREPAAYGRRVERDRRHGEPTDEEAA